MLPGRVEQLPVTHRGHLHVGLELHVGEFFAVLVLQGLFERLGIVEQKILGFRRRLLTSSLCLTRLVVADLRFQALPCLPLLEELA